MIVLEWFQPDTGSNPVPKVWMQRVDLGSSSNIEWMVFYR